MFHIRQDIAEYTDTSGYFTYFKILHIIQDISHTPRYFGIFLDTSRRSLARRCAHPTLS